MHAVRLFWAGLAVLPAVAAQPTPSVPLMFVANRGQTHREARFMAKTPRLNAYFVRGEAVLEMRAAALRIQFGGGAAPREPEADGTGAGVVNFLVGPEESWVTAVPMLGGVAYRDIYPGIDARYSGSGPNLKSEYVVKPGQDPARIQLRYAGADRLTVEPGGALSIQVGRHTLRESAPVIYQERRGVRQPVEGGFQVNGDVVSFVVGRYDRTLPLTIDPVFYYLTLFGGSGADAAMSMAVDGAGSAYIAGYTSSYDMPTANPEQNFTAGGNEIFAAKLTPDGSGLVYCTYIGGRGDDRAYGIAVDAAGAAYITGSTTSSNFPVRGALQAKLSGGTDAFVLKLTAAGNALVYSTYLGGSGPDVAAAIAVDSSGSAYIAGDTSSLNFPAAAFQKSSRGVPDAFVAKLAADGSRLVYSTYLGGAGEDHATAVAVDAAGSAFVTGSTYSLDFPVANAYQPSLAGGQDVFVSKLAPDGNSLIFSTYLGGSNGMLGAVETGRGIALDSAGNAYVAGETSSVNFPIRSAVQSTNAGWQDAFVSKFGAAGSLIYSTYIGGVNMDMANAIAVDRSGFAYIAGETTSANLASILVSQNAPTGIFDAFVVKLSPAGDSVAALAYLGGIGADNATAIVVDSSSNVYLAGWTQSPNFATVNGFQTINGGNYSAFVGKVNFTSGAISVSVTPASASLNPSQTQQFAATVANTSNTSVTWSISPAGAGSISSTGLYTAPASVSAQQAVTVKAVSAADSTKFATATVTLYPPVAVTVAPPSALLYAGQAQQFTATVTNTSNNSVTWSISPAGAGSISSAGLYTAPASVAAQQTVTVKAASVGDPTKFGTATVTLSPASMVNLAQGKAASQSSLYDPGTPASKAVDGNTDGNWSHNSVMCTNSDPYPWWQVDLGVSVSVSSVIIWNRTDGSANRLGNYWIFVSDTPFSPSETPTSLQSRTGTWSSHQTSYPNPSSAITVNAQGRYVRVQLAGSDFLHMAEVQVFGTPAISVAVTPGGALLTANQTQQFTATVTNASNTSVTWSISPAGAGAISSTGLYTAPASVTAQQTVTVQAASVADPTKFTTATVMLSPTSMVNLAQGKPASQSSTYDPATPASNAVDGNTDGNWSHNSVTCTNGDLNAWWQVDLGVSVSVSSVVIWNRTDGSMSRLADYWIFVSDTPFSPAETPASLQSRAGTWSNHQASYPNPSSTIPVNAQGRYVRVQLAGSNFLHVAEVQVFGTPTVSIAVTPANTILTANQTQQFTATVTNTSNTAVTWSISPTGVGSISAAGLYTAPASIPAQQTVTVRAASVADPTKFTTATVILSATGAVNLAQGKSASESSIYDPGTPASKAVDGDTDGAWSDNSVTCTNNDPNAWWQVDLGVSVSVSSVVIWNRTDGSMNRLGDYWIFVSDTPFSPAETPASLQSRAGTWSSHRSSYPNPSSTIPVNAPGRYVRVQLAGTNFLHMAEVQVFGAFR